MKKKPMSHRTSKTKDKMSHKTSKPRFPHYWMCFKCATEMGGVHPGGVGTVCGGVCQYCNGKNQAKGEAIIPWVDFDWPQDRKTDFRAKVSRD